MGLSTLVHLDPTSVLATGSCTNYYVRLRVLIIILAKLMVCMCYMCIHVSETERERERETHLKWGEINDESVIDQATAALLTGSSSSLL